MQHAWRVMLFGTNGYQRYMKAGFEGRKFAPLDDSSVFGKRCVVTGGNQGIGLEIVESLAHRRAKVVMCVRSKEKGEAAKRGILARGRGDEEVEVQICDLSEMSSVEEAARSICGAGPVHVLVNNGGAMCHGNPVNSQGLDMTFATNTLGTYAFTKQLLPALEAAGGMARVITVSSGGMLTENLKYKEKELLPPPKGDATRTYAFDKRRQVALTERWARLYERKDPSARVAFFSMHPGWCETEAVKTALPSFHQTLAGKLRTAAMGADTAIWLALADASKLKSGGFYFDREEEKKHILWGGTEYTEAAVDELVVNLDALL